MYPYTVASGTPVLLAPPVASSPIVASVPINESVPHVKAPASQANHVTSATMRIIATPRSNGICRSTSAGSRRCGIYRSSIGTPRPNGACRSTSAGPRRSEIYRSSSATRKRSYRNIFKTAPVQPVLEQHVAMATPPVMRVPSVPPLIVKGSGLAPSVQSGAEAATPGCPRQFDAGAFEQWAKNAVEVPGSSENNQLYGFLTECFLDADGDKDGLVSVGEFDFLVEKAAKLPRQFGLPLNWSEMYPSIEEKQKGRMAMFAKLDTESRKAIGLNEWINWSFTHIAEKVRGMDMKSINWNALESMGTGGICVSSYLPQLLWA